MNHHTHFALWQIEADKMSQKIRQHRLAEDNSPSTTTNRQGWLFFIELTRWQLRVGISQPAARTSLT